MKIKRFIGNDIKEALSMVKASLGPNAVIIANKPIEDKVEIIAAVDFEFDNNQEENKVIMDAGFNQDLLVSNVEDKYEKIFNELNAIKITLSNASENYHYNLLRESPEDIIYRQLFIEMGFSKLFIENLISTIKKQNQAVSLKKIIHGLHNAIQIRGFRPVKPLTLFTGLSGSGKTTTLLKVAIKIVKEQGPSNLIIASNDLKKPSGYEQLRNYGDILNIEVKEIESINSLFAVLSKGAHVLFDFSGDKNEFINQLIARQIDFNICYTLSATSNLEVIAQHIGELHFLDHQVIITKTDEYASMTKIICFMIENGLNFSYMNHSDSIQSNLINITRDSVMEKIYQYIQSNKNLAGVCFLKNRENINENVS